MTPAVQMSGIVQKFGTFTALDQVSLTVEPGSLHALVGENGAGKTTLMKVLYGALRPTQGEVRLHGEPRAFRNQAEAIAAGIGMVSQHYAIIPELTCLQNLMLGAEPGWAIKTSAAEERANSLAQKMGFRFDWQKPASGLSPAGAQKLEILKLLWRQAKVMILDEPTAMLSPSDSDALYASLTSLAAEGNTIIVVTHRLPEVMDFCRQVTVLRGGKLIEALPVSETNSNALASLIVGRSMVTTELIRQTGTEPLLEVSGLTVKGHRGDEAVKGATFTLRKGEVVGIAGVDGNGQRELFQALSGNRRVEKGTITLGSKTLTHTSQAARIAEGLRQIPEDRHAEAVIEDWTLDENAALGLQRHPRMKKGPWINRPARLEFAGQVAERFRTKHSGFHKPMKSLSGGNQQRFVAARALAIDAKVVLAFQPTRGLDIDGTQQVYAALRESAQAGGASLVVSFDLDELLENCDRVMVICHGVLTEVPAGQATDRAAIGRLMVGAEA